MESLRLAHLSDPHFASATYSPRQFLSKRWLGNMNLLLFRRHGYQTAHLWHLPELIDTLKVEVVCITGDFATTSRDPEFEEGALFVSKFKQPVFVLPGNHDVYTKGSQKEKRFYHYFPNENLKKDRVIKASLGKGWWWIGLDCALATSIVQSNGKFFKEMEEKLESALSEIPSNERIIVGNHFPLYSSKKPTHDLTRCKFLQAILKRYPQVKLYLHGHDHAPYIIDRRDEGFPLVLNSGSCAHQPDGTFYVLELTDKAVLVEKCLFRKEEDSFSWVIDFQKSYSF